MGQAAQRVPAGNAVHYGRRRPEETTLPRRQAELVGIFAPCVGCAALGNNAAELIVCQYIDPGRRSNFPALRVDHVFAPIRRETTETVPQDQIGIKPSWSRGCTSLQD